MASDLHKYSVQESLNLMMNSGEDALKVDLDNVTLKTEGSDINIEVHTDKTEDSMLMFSHTVAAGTGGTSLVPLVDSDGHLQVDALSSALPSGAATAANQTTIIGHVDGIETLQTSTNTKLDTLETTLTAIETDQAAIETLLTAANVDHAANEVLLGTIDADTGAIKTAVEIIDNAISGSEMQVDIVADGAGLATAAKQDILETTLTAIETDIAANEVLLGTIDADTGAIKTAVEVIDNAISGSEMQVDIVADGAGLATDANLALMLYGTALAVTAVHGGSDHSLGATYEAFYIGVGGDVSLDCVTSGTNIVFKNLASGQMLPVRATVVNATNTTATNIVALKA
jgi:hypothetical protein